MAAKEISVAVIGSDGVGKTAIIVQLMSAVFEEEHNPTSGEDNPLIFQHEGTPLKIFDTPGGDSHAEAREGKYSAAEGFIAVYSIIHKESFDELKQYIEKLQDVKGTKRLPIVLVGCKADKQDDRQVPHTDGEEYAKELNCPFLEITAKEREQVVDVFTQLVREIDKIEAEKKACEKPEAKKGGCCTVL